MVAFVSGNGIGLATGSASILGGQGIFGSAALGSTKESAYLNIFNGNLSLQDADGFIAARGISASLTRTYNSQGVINSASGWRNGPIRRLVVEGTPLAAGSKLTLVEADGSTAIYALVNGKYETKDGGGAYQTIAYDSNSKRWIWQGTHGDQNGLYEVYDQNGLLRGTYDQGGQIRSYAYKDGTSLLSEVVDEVSKDKVVYNYDASNVLQSIVTSTKVQTAQGLVEKVVGSVIYGYEQGRLSRVTVDLTPDNSLDNSDASKLYTTDYGYDASGRVNLVKQADGTEVRFRYDASGRVDLITDGFGKTTSIAYAAGRTTVTDALGSKTSYVYNTTTQLLSEVVVNYLPTVGTAQTTKFGYDAHGTLNSVLDARGVQTTYTVDAATGNWTERRDSAGNKVTRTYTSGNLLETETIYSTADASSAQTTRYVYNDAKQLRYVVSPEGRVTRFEYDAQGLRKAQSQFNGALLPQAGAPGFGVDALDGWSAKQALDKTYLTTYGYDMHGKLSRTTAYTAVSAAGVGIGGITQRFVYDHAGQLLASHAGDAQTATITYDGMGRVLTKSNPDGVTKYTYAGNSVSAEFTAKGDAAATRTTTTIYAANGEVQSVVEVARGVDNNGTVTNTYDASGRLHSSTGPNGLTSYVLYDAAGRKSAQIEANGLLTRYFYNAKDQLIKTTVFATTVSVSGLMDAAGKPKTAESITPAAIATEDRSTYFAYDAAGRLVDTVDAAGFVTRLTYDSASRVVQSTRYAKVLTATQLAQVGTTALSLTTDAADRSTYNVYDKDGLLLATVDEENYVTVMSYDAAGNIAQTVRYAAKTGTPTATTLAGLGLVANAAEDRATTFEYGAGGRLLKQTASDGSFVQYRYDTAGNVSSVERHTGRATYTRYDELGRVTAELDASGVARLGNLPQGETVESVWERFATHYTYNAAGQRTSATDTAGNRTLFYYDGAGKLRYSVDAGGAVTEQVYDAFGELTKSIQYATRIAPGTLANLEGGDKTRLDATVQGLGNKGANRSTVFYYDNAGRLSYTVDGTGAVTERKYNAFGQVAQTIQYADAFTGSQLSGLNGGRVAGGQGELATLPDFKAATNSRSLFYYDNLGRLTYSVSAKGEVAKKNYTAFNQLDSTNTFATSVDIATLGGTQAADLAKLNALTAPLQQSYSYDKRGMLIRFKDAANGITETSYNAFGDVSQVIKHATAGATGVATAQDIAVRTIYDRLGRVKATIDNAGAVTLVQYDEHGNVSERTSYATALSAAQAASASVANIEELSATLVDKARDSRVRYTYDIDNQLTATFTALGYDAAKNESTWSVVSQQYDDAGRVVARTAYRTPLVLSEAAGSARTGQPAAAANDGIVRFSYDSLNRVVATATALGPLNGVQRWSLLTQEYDSFGNVSSVTQFATAFASNAPLADLRLHAAANTALDRTTRYAYDNLNRKVLAVDAQGGATRMVYDAKGNLVQTIQYATAVTQTGVLAADFRPATAPGDRETRYFHDLNNRLAYTLDASGAVSENRYDSFGNLTTTVAYATQLSAVQMGGATSLAQLQSLLASDAGRDRYQRFIYDANGRQTLAIDGKGYLSETNYDALGRVTSTLQHMAPATGLTGASTAAAVAAAVTAAKALAGTDAAKQPAVVRYGYDAQGNRTSITDELNVSETYRYDALGNKTHFINKAGAEWQYKYDAAGRLTDEISPKIKVYGNALDATHGNLGTGSDATPHVHMEYDALGNLRNRTEGYNTAGMERSTEYVYDSLGRQVQTVQAGVGVYDAAADAKGTAAGAGFSEKQSGERATLVSYDVLGNAVSNRDAAGNLSTKLYDRLGRVRYEIDAAGYVTGYERNAFGEVETLTRYAAPAAAVAGKSFADMSLADFQRDCLRASTGEDRYLWTSLDKMGRTSKVKEAIVSVYDRQASGAEPYLNAGRVTETTYDAFGAVRMQSVYGHNQGGSQVTEAAVKRFYYNNRGEKVAEVIALNDAPASRSGYLTTYDYDYAGNLAQQKEYASDKANWTDYGYTAPTAKAEDRTISYTYNRAGQRTSETKVGVTYTPSTDGAAPVTGNLVTTYDYDKVGNQVAVTDALKGTTYTYFDVLGRVTAVARRYTGAAGAITDGGSPLTELRPDLHGNTVLRIDHRAGASAATVEGYTAANANSSDNHVAASRYDVYGRLLESMDAEQFRAGRGTVKYSYDILGRQAKQWSTVTAHDGSQRTTFQVTVYDALGRTTEVQTPGNRDLVDQQAEQLIRKISKYNGFGELIATAVAQGNGAEQQTGYVKYDQAGRAWLTNMGDGVDKVTLFDVNGRATAEIRSTDRANPHRLAGLTKADQALNVGETLRKETRYNLLGQVVDSRTIAGTTLGEMVFVDGAWVARPLGSSGGNASSMIRIGDPSDAGRKLLVRYRVAGGAWTDAPDSRVQWLEGTPVFSTRGLATGDYEFKVLVQYGANAPLERDGGFLHVNASEDADLPRQVLMMYLMLFNRPADVPGLNFWIDAANNGLPPHSIMQGMLGSPEAATRFAGTPNDIIKTIYREAFNIPESFDPDYVNQVSIWAQRYGVAAGSQPDSRGQVLYNLMLQVLGHNGPAGQLLTNRSVALRDYLLVHHGMDKQFATALMATAITNPAQAVADANAIGALERRRLDVIRLYIAVLGRAPESAGIDFWIKPGITPANVAEGLLSSLEGRQSWLYPDAGLTPEQYRLQLVNRAYALVAGRAPSSSELNEWLPKLTTSPVLSRADFILQLMDKVGSYDGSDSAAIADRNLFNNKVALAYAAGVTKGHALDAEAAAVLLSGVTAVASAQDAAEKARIAVAAAAASAAPNVAAATLAAGAVPLEEMRRVITRMFMTFQGRVPDKAGLDYYIAIAPTTLAQWESLANGFLNAAAPDTTAAQFAQLDNKAFVERLYTNALGILPSGEEVAAEMQSFIKQLNEGKARNQVGLAIVTGMLESLRLPGAELSYRALLNNRTAVALTIAQSMNLPSNALQRGALATVTATDMRRALDDAYSAYKTMLQDAMALTTGQAAGAHPIADAASAAATASATAATAFTNLNKNADAVLRLQLTQLYVIMLGRTTANPPDIAGLEFYVTGAGRLPVEQQAYNISISPESRSAGLFTAEMSNRAFVEKLYSRILGASAAAAHSVNLAGPRVAPPRDVAFWTAQLEGQPASQRGKVAMDILNAIMAYGSWTPDGAGAALLAGRAAFAQDVTNIFAVVDTNTNNEVNRLSAQQAALKKVMDDRKTELTPLETAKNSAESAKNTAVSTATSGVTSAASAGDALGRQRLQITRLYASLLQRTVGSNPLTMAEVEYWANTSLDAVAYSFINASNERGSIFLPSDSNDTFVRKLYTAILGRSPNLQSEVDFYVTYLVNNASQPYVRGKLAVSILDSFMAYSDSEPAQVANKKAFDTRVGTLLTAMEAQANAAATAAANDLTKARNLNSAVTAAEAEKTRLEGLLAPATTAAAEATKYLTLGGRIEVLEAYAALRGTADYAGVIWQMDALTRGSTVDRLITDLIAVDYPADDVGFIKRLYSKVLGRVAAPTQGEIDFYLTALKSMTRLQVARDFMRSTEGRGYYPAIASSLDSTFTAKANADIANKGKIERDLAAANASLQTATANRNAFMSVATATTADTKARNVLASYTAVIGANVKVLAADDKFATYASALLSYNAKYSEWKAAETAYLAFDSATLNKLKTAQTGNALVKTAVSAQATAFAAQSSATSLAAANPSANTARQVAQLVQTILNRAPTVADMQLWGDLVKNSGYTLVDVVNGLINSSEAKSRNLYPATMTNDAFVTQLYTYGLNRAISADPGALRFWSDRIAGQVTRADIAVAIIQGANEGWNNDTKTVNDRAAAALKVVAAAKLTAADIDTMIAQANQQARTAATTADAAATTALNGSPDALKMVQLARLFTTILDRAPDGPGFRFYLDGMRKSASLTPAVIAQGMIDSIEGQRLLPSTLSAADFVTRLFVQAMGRTPSTAELSKYSGQLPAQTRGQVAVNIYTDLLAATGNDPVSAATRALFIDKVDINLGRALADARKFDAGIKEAKTLTENIGTLPLLNTAPVHKALNGKASDGSRTGLGTNLYTVDRWGNVTEVRDLRDPNFKITYTYNQDNQVTFQTNNVAVASSDASVAKTYTQYDALGRVAARIDANGGKTTVLYDSNGNVVKETDAEGGVATSAYDLFGNRLSLKRWYDASTGIQTNYGYDHLGRLTSTWNEASVPVYVYQNTGVGTMPMDPLSYSQLLQRYEYDELGRRIRTTAADGVRTIAEYDLNGHTIATATVDHIGNQWYRAVTSYDVHGNRKATLDSNGKVMRWNSDSYGQLQDSVDMGGGTVKYTYDAAGRKIKAEASRTFDKVRLVSRMEMGDDGEMHEVFVPESYTETKSGSIRYTYTDGQLAEIYDDQSYLTTSYTYDAAGNRLSEKQRYGQAQAQANQPVRVQDNTNTYDMDNRLAGVNDGQYELKYTYDKNGNRLTVTTRYGNAAAFTVYNAFDKMNRQTVVNGDWVGGKAVFGEKGHEIAYDKLGNRLSDTYKGVAISLSGAQYVTTQNATTKETYSYDGAGRLEFVKRDGLVIDERHYDAAGRITESGMLVKMSDNYRRVTFDAGVASQRRRYSFDIGGHMTRQQETNYDLPDQDIYFVKDQWNMAGGYDAMGNLTGYTVVREGSSRGDNGRYQISYEWFDGAREGKVTLATNNTTNSSDYDAFGNRLTVTDQSGKVLTRLWYDADGHVQSKQTVDDKGKVDNTFSLIVNCNVFGEEDFKRENILGSTYVAVSSPMLSAAPSSYSVQSASETLHSVAQNVWGDASLWYLIGDANALDADAKLAVGQVLRIPARANTVHSTSDTFRPYDASAAVGNTAPVMPPPRPGGCGGIGQIVMIVVAVVATIYTAGAASGLIAVANGVAGATVGGALGFTAAMTTGAGLATAGLSMATVGAAMVGGALGSLASQAVGVAIGAQDKINWKGVALSAVGNGVTAGLGNTFSGVMAANTWQAAASRAIVSNLTTQAIGKATGLQEHFSWRSVAASATGAAVGHAMGDALGLNDKSAIAMQFGERLMKTSLSGIISGTSAAIARGGKIDMRSIATDAFGNALGGALVDSVRAKSSTVLLDEGATGAAENDQPATPVAKERVRNEISAALKDKSGRLAVTIGDDGKVQLGLGEQLDAYINASEDTAKNLKDFIRTRREGGLGQIVLATDNLQRTEFDSRANKIYINVGQGRKDDAESFALTLAHELAHYAHEYSSFSPKLQLPSSRDMLLGGYQPIEKELTNFSIRSGRLTEAAAVVGELRLVDDIQAKLGIDISFGRKGESFDTYRAIYQEYSSTPSAGDRMKMLNRIGEIFGRTETPNDPSGKDTRKYQTQWEGHAQKSARDIWKQLGGYKYWNDKLVAEEALYKQRLDRESNFRGKPSWSTYQEQQKQSQENIVMFKRNRGPGG